MAMTGLRCLLWPSLVKCMERMSSCWHLTSSAYVCLYCYLCALNLKCLLESANYWRSMQREVVCILNLMRYFAVQINNTLQWRWWVCVAYFDLRWLNVWNVLAVDEQRVRLLVLLSMCVIALNLRCVVFESANYWRSIQCDVVCNLNLCATLLFK